LFFLPLSLVHCQHCPPPSAVVGRHHRQRFSFDRRSHVCTRLNLGIPNLGFVFSLEHFQFLGFISLLHGVFRCCHGCQNHDPLKTHDLQGSCWIVVVNRNSAGNGVSGDTVPSNRDSGNPFQTVR